MSEDAAPLVDAVGWIEAGDPVALATVVGTWGSSPRPPGSLLAVRADGRFSGSVSGGCVEGSVVTEALAVIARGTPRLLDFGVSDERAWAVGLACGGTLQVFVEPAGDAALLRRLIEDRPVALATELATGRHALVGPATVTGEFALDETTLAAARRALHADESLCVEGASGTVFVGVFNPPLRMIIVGAVHVAQALAPMAALAGFRVTVVDPRESFASAERFPGIALCHDWPDEALGRLRPDERTAVVAFTHDPKLDDPALEAAMRSPAFYIGALGSRRTHGRRCERLSARGFAPSDLLRIHGPIGLDLGGRTAAEIAVATLAEAIATRYGKRPAR